MNDTAAHLVDRVIPHVPIRQWVMTFPRRVRYHLAADPKVATMALREVTRTLFTFQRRRARRLGVRPERAHSNGAITFVQRFNSALELSLHFHILVPDGVYIREGLDLDARPRFVQIDAPTLDEVVALLDQIGRRVERLLSKHGRLDEDSSSEADAEPHLLLAARAVSPKGRPFVEEALPPLCARKDGYSLHAGRAVHKNDRASLEQLARYGLRPALALNRLTEAPCGTLLYEMKRRFADGRQTLRFTPREFLLRLCALVPPRGFHMVRYHGVFAANARGRYALTGRGRKDHHADEPPSSPTRPAAVADTAPPPRVATACSTGTTPDSPPATESSATREARPAPAHARPASARPLDGLDGIATPDDPGRPRRLDWALLMKRCYAIDVFACPRCQGPMSLIAVIENEAVARRILVHLGLPARPPPRGKSSSGSKGQLLRPEPEFAFEAIDPPLLA